MQKIGRHTLYDAATGIYTSDVAYSPASSTCIFEYLLGSVDFDDQQEVLRECGSGRTITLGRLKLDAQRLGVGLINKCKLKPGDTVLLYLYSSIDFAVALLASQFAGLRVALANPDYLPTELRHVYRLTKPKKVFVSYRNMHRLSKASIGIHHLVITDSDVAGFNGVLSIKGLMSDETAAKQAKAHIPADLNDTAYLPFSSGTTGLPKAVEISHNNVINMVEIFHHTPSLFPKDKDGAEMQFRTLNFLPFFHAYALILMLHYPIRKRGHTSIIRPFQPEAYCRLVKELQVNFLALVPPVLTVLTKHAHATPKAFGSVQQALCGAAPLDFETQSAFTQKTGVPVQQAFGMTETTVGALGLPSSDTASGSVGCLYAVTKARICDVDTGKHLGPGERGELQIHGPQVCKGYYGNAAATRDTFTSDGYLRTGDIAVVDPTTGEFSIVDRLKELIKYKGFQVAPAELEGVLVSHPAIAAAAVVGVYDKQQATELPLAFLELKPDHRSSTDLVKDIDTFVRSKVSHHKYLRGGIRILDKVPVSASGKILRKEIRKLLKAELEAKETSAVKANL
ncbi:related to 4-coumarate--CoA ligase [Sporisorium reilianum SRZ2]|uniref:Related to 4-coumarate--CoA ligase n=1 Tax=Sporisorium reilianum (strain SRZ2) TaxID=999809 RepID=E6ZPY9_SPORE|nr:related to 4-coumarate--CoA ligase [Sporisorium reilianum SRZ2]